MVKIPFPKTEKTLLDPKYRYKRDMIVTEKSGQFYVIKNLQLIADDIKIKLNDLVKFLQKKINQPIIFDKSTNTYKIKSGQQDLEKYLEEYIVLHLVCKKCNLPEVKETRVCSACGHQDIVEAGRTK